MFKRLWKWIKNIFVKEEAKVPLVPEWFKPHKRHPKIWDDKGRHMLRRHHFGTFSPPRPFGIRKKSP